MESFLDFILIMLYTMIKRKTIDFVSISYLFLRKKIEH